MKVLVTGGAGFIGSHIVDLLLKRGYQVRIIDSLEPPVHPQRKTPAYVPGEAEFVLGDVCNQEKLERALKGVDAVFHLAAYQDYLTDFSRFALVNDAGTALLYEIIINKDLPVKKVVLASSQAVYGEGKYECPAHGSQYPHPRSLHQLMRRDWELHCPVCHEVMKPVPCDETQVNPHNQYAVSKYCQELYALTLGRRYRIPTVVLRYSVTQGPRQSFHNAYSGILRIFSLRLLLGLPPVIYEDGRQLRDYVYVADAAQASLLALEREAADFQVFNVGGSQPFTVMEYAQLLKRLLGKNIEHEMRGEFRFGDTRHVISDISKLRALGWEPTTPVERIAREYLDWIKAQPGISDYYAQAAQELRRRGVIRSAAQ